MRTPLYREKNIRSEREIKTNDEWVGVGSKTSVTDTYSVLRRYPHDAHMYSVQWATLMRQDSRIADRADPSPIGAAPQRRR